ncbi:MAG: hypothetical protein ACRD03_04980 [Acidimicrobiales bacterium]
MRAEGVSFRHAVELLRSGAPTSSDGPAPKRTTVRKLAAPFDVSAEDRELLGEVIGFYHQTLRESPEAIEFLERRRIAYPEAVERFRLGFANRTLGYRLPDKKRHAGADIRGRGPREAPPYCERYRSAAFSASIVRAVIDPDGSASAPDARSKITSEPQTYPAASGHPISSRLGRSARDATAGCHRVSRPSESPPRPP